MRKLKHKPMVAVLAVLMVLVGVTAAGASPLWDGEGWHHRNRHGTTTTSIPDETTTSIPDVTTSIPTSTTSTTGGGDTTTTAPTSTTTVPVTVPPVTTTTMPSTTTTTVTPAPGTVWIPAPVTPWQWEIDHPLNTASASDMGTGVTTYTGQPAPDPVMYDIDGFDTPAATVAALHATGRRAVCYIEVGAVESYRPDAGQFPAADLGATMPGYPQERYIDIRDIAGLRPVMDARLQMCRDKGFDAVEPDIDDSYASTTGFPLTLADQVRYDSVLASDAHARGLSFALKNGDTPAFASALLPSVDFVVDEQCFEYSSCGAFTPFVAAGKAVFEVEYNVGTSAFCPQANALNFNAEGQNVALNGGRKPCR